jgi:hypothetical protein
MKAGFSEGFIYQTSEVGIGIQQTNAGIDTPASFFSVRYRANVELGAFIPVPDNFPHR